MAQTYLDVIPLDSIEKIQTYHNTSGKTITQIKKETGADYAINAWYFDNSGKDTCHVKADGKILENDTSYDAYAIGWDEGPDAQQLLLLRDKDLMKNYGSATTLMANYSAVSKIYCNSDASYPTANSGLLLTDAALMLYCTTAKVTPTIMRDYFALLKDHEGRTAKYAAKLDGGGSTQCIFPGNRAIYSSRRVPYILLVWLKPEKQESNDENPDKVVVPGAPNGYKIFGAPGHGPGNPNKSPDGSYFEHEGVWGIWEYVRAALTRCGFEYEECRTADYRPANIAEVTAKANAYDPDLYLSLHTNAANSSGVWSDARGACVFTSSGPDTANRNRAAMDVLIALEEAGIPLFGEELYHSLLEELTDTHAPAILVEYGFHTNQTEVEFLKMDEYRQVLAEATVQGICEYFDVPYVELNISDIPTPPTDPTPEPISALKFLQEMGLFQGLDEDSIVTAGELAEALVALADVVTNDLEP